MKDLIKLFFIFFRVGAFTFGGGYAMIPVIQKEVVEKENLITEKDFLDIIAVAQSLPGAIAVNTSVFIGFKLKGIKGSVSALMGTIIPSIIIITIFAIFYTYIRDIEIINNFFKGVRPAIIALILVAGLRLAKNIEPKYFNFLLGLGTFILIIFLNVHPIFAIIISAILGVIYHFNKKDVV